MSKFMYETNSKPEIITPEMTNTLEALSGEKPAYDYGQNTINQSLPKETKQQMKEMLGGKEIIF